MAKFIGDWMISAKERFLGEDYWIPKTADEIVEVPKHQLGAHKCIERDEPFSILSATYNESKTPIYHLVISWHKELSKKELEDQKLKIQESVKEDSASTEDDKALKEKSVEPQTACDAATAAQDKIKIPEATLAVLKSFNDKQLSLFRSNDYQEANEVYHSCLRCKLLFDSQDNLKDLRLLLSKIRTHPLWEEVHMACRLDYRWYFTKVSKDSGVTNLLTIPCSPEGYYPLTLAIKYGHVDLVKTVVQLGASIAMTDVTGKNALHWAAEIGNANIIDVLSTTPHFKSAVNSLNKDGCTPLFLSIRCGNPFIVTALMRHGAELNVTCKGRSAMFEAMQQTSGKTSEVLQLLIDKSPAVLKEKDEVTGNGPLHFAASKHGLHSLLSIVGDGELDIDETNKAGQTAMHIFTHRGDLGGVITLATYNAQVDIQDDRGLSPLHVAVSRADIWIVKALLVLGANANTHTISGDSPRHMAARLNHKLKREIVDCLNLCGAKRCPPNKVGCASGCIDKRGLAKLKASASEISFMSDSVDLPEDEKSNDCGEQYLQECVQKECIDSVMECFNNAKSNPDSQKQLITVLSLDGGGIRGLVMLQILGMLQSFLPRPVAEYFDWIGGTSTGSFVAAGLSLGLDIRQCVNIYLKLKDQIFEGWARPYNSEKLELFVKKELGEKHRMKDLTRHKIMIPTVRADKYPIELVLFRSYTIPCLSLEENAKYGYDNPEDTYLWRALRCSSAAPTFFSSVDGKYVDGGLVSNNPSMDLLSEVHRWNTITKYHNRPVNEQLQIGCMLSIGCGAIPSQVVDTLDFGNPYSTAVAMRNLGMILVDQVTQTEGSVVDHARNWCHSLHIPFFRLTTPLAKVVQMDTKDDVEIISFMWLTLVYTKTNVDKIEKIAHLLKKLKDN